MGCSRVGRTIDSHSSSFATKTKYFGRVRDIADGGVQNFIQTRKRQQLILGGDAHANLFAITDHIDVGAQVPRPKTKQMTADLLTAGALCTTVAELDKMVTKHLDDLRPGRRLVLEKRVGRRIRRKRTVRLQHDLVETPCGTGAINRMHMVQFRSERDVSRSIIAWTVVETCMDVRDTSAGVERGAKLEQCCIIGLDALVGLGESGTHPDGPGRRETDCMWRRNCQQQN